MACFFRGPYVLVFCAMVVFIEHQHGAVAKLGLEVATFVVKTLL